MKSILDKSFEYTPAAQTDLKKTFARVRREQRADEAEQSKNIAEAQAKVKPLRQRSQP